MTQEYFITTSDKTGAEFKAKIVKWINENTEKFDPTELNNLISALQTATDGNTAGVQSLQATVSDMGSKLNLLSVANGGTGVNSSTSLAQIFAQDTTRIRTQVIATSTTNLDTLGQNSIYVPSTVTPAGSLPFPTGTVYVVISIYQDSTYQGQIAFSLNTQSSNGQIASRGYTGTSWGPWRTTTIANGAVQSNLFAQYALSVQVGNTNSSTVLNLDTIGQSYYISSSVTNLTGSLPYPIGTAYWLEYAFVGSLKKQVVYPESTTLKPLWRTLNGSTWTAWKGFS